MPLVVEEVVDSLCNMASEIEKLPDFTPNWYSKIGMDLVKLASWLYGRAEFSQVLEQLVANHPRVLPVLQNASTKSELELERVTIEDFNASGGAITEDMGPRERLFEVISEYPYEWSYSKVMREVEVLKALTEREISSSDLVLYVGTSGLPFSGLEMYFVSEARVAWLDESSDSFELAVGFVNLAEKLGIVDSKRFSIHHSLAELPHFLVSAPVHIIFLESRTLHDTLVFLNSWVRVESVLVVDFPSSGELLYPRADFDFLHDNFDYVALSCDKLALPSYSVVPRKVRITKNTGSFAAIHGFRNA